MKKLIVILAAIAMVGAFTASAIADVELYGSARFRTYYIDKSKEFSQTGYDDSDLDWNLGWLSRFGVNFKSDKMTGKFELDARPGIGASYSDTYGRPVGGNLAKDFGNTGGSSHIGNMRLRHLWGEYDFGPAKLMVGQNFPLYDAPVSNINFYSGGLQEFGGIGYLLARTAQIRLTFGDFKIAFMTPDTRQGALGDYNADLDVNLPKIEVRYDMKMDTFALNFIGGYQTYDVVNATDGGESIDSWVLGVRGQADFGPMYAKLALTYRQNGQNYGAWTHVSKEKAAIEGTDVKDATGYGGVAALGFKVNDMFSIEASAGMIYSEQDTTYDNEDDAAVYALSLPIKLAPGVSITPEFIYQDEKEHTTSTATVPGTSEDDGDVTIIGVFWKIDFK
jgi:hypothetical protein